MPNHQALQERLQELSIRKWNLPAIEARFKAIAASGFPKKTLDREKMLADKEQILDRVQLLAEEYNYLGGNCARGAALALMDEFGLGDMEVVRALSPFPGFGGTGWMCGGVTGGLIAIGLFAGSPDIQNLDAMRATMVAAKQFMARFEQEVGAVTCPKIQEDVVFGRYMNPSASPENMKAFEEARGFEKCGLLPGIGARIAAGIIIESL